MLYLYISVIPFRIYPHDKMSYNLILFLDGYSVLPISFVNSLSLLNSYVWNYFWTFYLVPFMYLCMFMHKFCTILFIMCVF